MAAGAAGPEGPRPSGAGLAARSPHVRVGAALISDLEKRVEVGFLAGSIVATLVMMVSLYQRMQRGVPDSIDSLITQIEHEPLEF